MTSIDSTSVISSPNPTWRQDDSVKWPNIGFGEDIGIIEIKICTYSVALAPVSQSQTQTQAQLKH